MDQIAEAIWTFGRVFYGADRHCDHRLDQSVATMVLSEPSGSHDTSSNRKKRCYTANELLIQIVIFNNTCAHVCACFL